MGGKSSAPSPPDYGPLIKANEKTSKFAMKLAQEQWDWARKVYDENKGLMTDTNTSFLKTMEDARIASEEDRERYKTLYQPQEDRMIHDLNTYDTEERRDKEVGAAQANVAQQFDEARDQAASRLESFGVNPSDTRYKGLDLNLRTQEAAAKAAAGTNAATGVEDKGRALRAAAIDIGKGYPSSYTAAGQLGMQSAANAQAGNTNALQGGAQAMGTGPQWLGGSNEALGNWGQALNNQYSNQLGQFNANQSASSGWGTALGIFGGMAAKRFGFDEGGVVPEEISPSGGGQQDDVPVAVSVGEFVVPKETVSWFGEKHFHKLTEKAQQERVEQAVPTEAQPAAGGISGRPGMARGGMVEPPISNGVIGPPDGGGTVPLPGGEYPTPPGGGWIPGPRDRFSPPIQYPGPVLPGPRDRFSPPIQYPGPVLPGPRDRFSPPIQYPGPVLPGPRDRFSPPIQYPGPVLPGPRDRFSPPIQYPGPVLPLSRGVSMRPPPPIPHYGPDPGRGVGMPAPAPIPHYGRNDVLGPSPPPFVLPGTGPNGVLGPPPQSFDFARRRNKSGVL